MMQRDRKDKSDVDEWKKFHESEVDVDDDDDDDKDDDNDDDDDDDNGAEDETVQIILLSYRFTLVQTEC